MQGVGCSGMWAWCGMACRDVVVIWCEMWCDMECQLQFQIWCDVECDWNAKCVMWNDVVWNMMSWYVECCIMLGVESHVMWCEMCGIVVMKNVAYAMCCVIVMRCQMWKMMQCVGMSDVVVWCKIKMCWCNVMWNMVWCEMCCNVECRCGVE